RSDLLCRIKYRNTLPDIPFDPKFLRYPFENNRFTDYNTTSLEREHKHELLTDTDAGVKNGLIDPDAYIIDEDAELDDADKALLGIEGSASMDRKGTRHSRTVSWMRRNEYLSNEGVRMAQNPDKPETKVGYSVRKYAKNLEKYKDKESQIKAIEKTFEATKKPIIDHPTKPGVTAKRSYPLFPDFEMWKYSLALVTFDSDPSKLTDGSKLTEQQMSNSVIKGMQVDTGNQFVGYYTPIATDAKKRKVSENQDSETSRNCRDYNLAREYNWVVKSRDSGRDVSNVIMFEYSFCHFNKLFERVKLSKQRANVKGDNVNNRLTVEYRDFNEEELANQVGKNWCVSVICWL
ncbi:uncharacterized protein TRIADDRAFT_33941, partial [Trichoplax adhaerens]